jgi:hypothetical protein
MNGGGTDVKALVMKCVRAATQLDLLLPLGNVTSSQRAASKVKSLLLGVKLK